MGLSSGLIFCPLKARYQVPMQGKLVILGAGSLVGRLLARPLADRPGVVWLSRADWRAEDGPEALRPLLEGAGAVLCLAGAASAQAELSLNMTIGCAVCEAAPEAAQVFLASSQAVYPMTPGPHVEAAADPGSAYGASKLGMERACLGLRERVTALRLGNVVGADLLGRNIGLARVVLDVFPDGRTPRRSYIDPESLARVVIGLADLALDGALPKRLNVARAPLLEMGALAAAAGAAFETRPAPDGAVPEVAMHLEQLFMLLPEMSAPLTAEDALAAWRRCKAQ